VVEYEDEAGFSLVETLVAIVIVTAAVFALTAELTAYIHHQANEKSRTTAVRLMTSSIESARRLSVTQLTSPSVLGTNSSPFTDPKTGKQFTTTTIVQHCSLTDAANACTTPTSSAQDDVRVKVTISWLDGTATRTVTSQTTIADTSTSVYRPDGTGTLSSLVGGAASTATTVSVSGFTASPTPTTVSPAGTPASAVTLTLTTIGLTASTTSIPVTWTDDSGSHQWALTGGPSSWSTSVPAASITKVVSSGTSTLTFAATVPGTHALTTAAVTLKPGVDLSSCSVSPATVLINSLNRKTLAAETLSCTASGIASTDSVKVSYPSGSGTAQGTLTSSNGTSWTFVLPAGTSMASGLGLTEAFTFTATRASDSAAAVKAVTAVLA
jgi:type II secretory pathway pseudopilin PulG